MTPVEDDEVTPAFRRGGAVPGGDSGGQVFEGVLEALDDEVGLVGFVARIDDFDPYPVLTDASQGLARLQSGGVVLDQPVRGGQDVPGRTVVLEQGQAGDGRR